MIASTADPAWARRPLLALGVRVAQYGVPLLAGTTVTWVLAPVLARGLPTAVASALALLLAVVASLLVSRLTMRLAPLGVLLQMTMIFPDHAPSRLKVARRSTSTDEIRRQLRSEHPGEQEAAVTMLALVTALGRHDRHTRGHSERVRLFCDLLADELGLSDADAGRLRWAALIHDIGKLELSAAVLNKPGRLTELEWRAVRLHPEAGARLARPLEQWLGPWFTGIIEHHERYDGFGYPQGLVGEEISLAGRAVAVVDAFETMTAARSYRAAVSAVAARAELARCAGTHFDPAVVRAFLAIALPRLLWSVGPLAFVINVPFLRWVGDGGVRFAQAASTTATTAANAAGVTAAVVATGALPGAAAHAAPAHEVRVTSSVRRPAADAVAAVVPSTEPTTGATAVPRTPAPSAKPAPKRPAPQAAGGATAPSRSSRPSRPSAPATPAGRPVESRPPTSAPAQPTDGGTTARQAPTTGTKAQPETTSSARVTSRRQG